MKLFNRLFGNNKEPDYHQLLTKYNSYYGSLNTEQKHRFVWRLQRLLRVLNFEAAKGMEVKDEMKVIIGSAFILLTFGLDQFILTEYNRIHIAPRSYSYKTHNQLMSGDVNTQLKLISLSWPCVLKGFQINNDALNIAIHEFAHCLRIESFSSTFFQIFLNKEKWKEWELVARMRMQDLRQGKESILHEYASGNLMEFFAVSLETFFEKPAELKRSLPHLYAELCNLLNQNPLNTSNPIIEAI